MYAFIAGVVEDKGPPTVLRVGGMGYEIFVPERHRLRLPEVGESALLYTHLQMREDGMTLYGFPEAGEREIFRALISVSGVGPRVALAVLGDESAPRVLAGIRRGDPVPLLAIKGIGRRTAERIVLDLKEKAASWSGGLEAAELAAAAAAGGPDTRTQEHEAVLALQAMGLTAESAVRSLNELDAELRSRGSVEELIHAALRRIQPPA